VRLWSLVYVNSVLSLKLDVSALGSTMPSSALSLFAPAHATMQVDVWIPSPRFPRHGGKPGRRDRYDKDFTCDIQHARNANALTHIEVRAGGGASAWSFFLTDLLALELHTAVRSRHPLPFLASSRRHRHRSCLWLGCGLCPSSLVQPVLACSCTSIHYRVMVIGSLQKTLENIVTLT
jgi:hypothetical protein